MHRPDGEVVRIKTDQIVFVMSAANTGAKTRALSRIQLLNGFADVRENVDEVMLAIRNDDVLSSLTISGETSRRFVARMERSVIWDCREASSPPRIALRSIRATLAAIFP